MISDREKELLWDIDEISEYRLEKYSDEEIIDNMRLFLRFETFRETKRAADLLCKLDDAKLKKLEYIYDIPKLLHFEDALELMDRGLDIRKSAFTEAYLYYFGYDKEALVKYKHLLDFDTIINKKLWYVNKNKELTNNFMEVCYDELKEVTTRTLLETLEVNLGDDCPTWEMSLLMDKLVSINNRQFKDTEIIKELLLALTSLNTSNPLVYDRIFKHFDDKFIIDNIEYFNPIQLDYAGRLTQDMLLAVFNNDKLLERYEYGLTNINLQISDVALITIAEKVKNNWFLWKQKNIIKAYRTYHSSLEFEKRIDLVRIYLHNSHLDEEDLEYLKDKIKEMDITKKISKYAQLDSCTVPPLALERLFELKEHGNDKN